MIITAEIGYLNPNTSPESSGTLYLASEHFVTRSSDTLANQYFAGRLDGEVRYALKLSTQFWGGNSTIGIGSLDIINDDGELDDWASYEFRDQSIVIKQHTRGASYNSAVILVRGTIDKLEVTGEKRLRLVIRDPAEQLQVPITSTVFSGGTDADGVLKPILFGDVKSARPILVDEGNLEYHVSDTEILSVDTIYDQGVSVGTAYTQTTYGFQLDAAPSGKVVADIVGAGPGITTYTLYKKSPPGFGGYDGYTSLYNFGTLDPTASPNVSAYYWRGQLGRLPSAGGKYYFECKIIIYDHTSLSPDTSPDWNLGLGISLDASVPPVYDKPDNAGDYTMMIEDTGVNGGPVDVDYFENGSLNSSGTSSTGWFNDRIGVKVDFDTMQVSFRFNPASSIDPTQPSTSGNDIGPTLSIASVSPDSAFYPIVAAASKGTNQNNAIQLLQMESDLWNIPSGYTAWAGAGVAADESFEELTGFITDRIAALTFDTTSVQAISALTYGSPANEYTYGFQYDDAITAADILNKALGSIGGYWFVNRTGDIEVGQLTAPGTATLEFDDDEILGEISLRPDNAPGLVKGAGARKNWEVMRESEFAAGATQATRQQFSRAFRDEYRNSTTLPSRYAHAAGAPLGDNLLTASGAAEAEADRWAALYQTRRYFWNVDIAATTDKFDDLLDAIGDTVQITSDRFNLDNGKALRLVGVEGAFLSNVIRMTLWGEGATPLPVPETLLTDNLVSFYNVYDAATSSIADATGRNDLTLGAGTAAPGFTTTRAKIGQCVSTDGTSVFQPPQKSTPDGLVPTGSWTAACWVEFSSTSGATYGKEFLHGVWKPTSDNRAWALYAGTAANNPAGSDGVWVEASADGTAGAVASVGVAADAVDNLVLVIARYNHETGKLRIRANNGADSEVFFSGMDGTAAAAYRWIKDADDGNQLNGYLDKPGFWNRYLSDAECLKIFNNGAGVDHADLVRNNGWGYADYATAVASGDAWVYGDVVRLASAASEPAVDLLYLQNAAVVGYSGLVPRWPLGDMQEIDTFVVDASESEGINPDSWTSGWTDTSAGSKGVDYDFTTSGGLARLAELSSGGRADLRQTNNLDTDAVMTAVVFDKIKAASTEPSGLDTVALAICWDSASPRATVYAGIHKLGSSANWLVRSNAGNTTSATSAATVTRAALFVTATKASVWLGNDFNDVYHNLTPIANTGNNSITLFAGLGSQGNSTLDVGRFMVAKVTVS